jgi:WXG100 family type VII secretion target
MATDDVVAVTYAAMENAAAGFNTSASKLNNTVGDLNQQINTLLRNGSFTGTTADNFTANQNLLNQGLANMQQVIGKMSQVISEAQETYQSADRSAASLFQ